MRELGCGAWPGCGDKSFAHAINGRGDVVGSLGSGTYVMGGYRAHAVLWKDGATRVLGTLPQRPYSEAVAVNDAG